MTARPDTTTLHGARLGTETLQASECTPSMKAPSYE